MSSIILIALLLAAVISDLRTRRIPNRLVLVGLVAGLLLQLFAVFGDQIAASPGVISALNSFLGGVAVGAVGMLPLYLMRAMGAGDVKLMMVVGGFIGPHHAFGAIVLTFAIGGVLALAMALWQRSFHQLATNLRYMVTTSTVRAALGESPRFEPLQQTAGRMPYAVAIAAGTVLQLYLVRSGGWALS